MRIRALPPDSPVHRVIRAAEEQAEFERTNMTGKRIDAALDLVGGGRG